jgi:hypothetical protein
VVQWGWVYFSGDGCSFSWDRCGAVGMVVVQWGGVRFSWDRCGTVGKAVIHWGLVWFSGVDVVQQGWVWWKGQVCCGVDGYVSLEW